MSTLIRQVRLVPVGSPAPTSEPVDVRVRDGMVGDVVAGFARGALERGTAGDHPDIAYSRYVAWLEWLGDSGRSVVGPLVAVGEVVIGIALILGLCTGIMAFLGRS